MDQDSTTAFARALMQPEMPCPGGLVTWNGSDPARRFAVYRNNVVVSLLEATSGAFPVVLALVGEDFFRAMARAYILQRPPRSPVMSLYGQDFPDFIASFPPAAGLPYLADVARLEAARIRAHHAADAVPAGPAEFAAIPANHLNGLRILPHPSAVLLSSPHAVVSLWSAHQGALAIETVDPALPEDALVIRPDLDVHVIGLRPGEKLFLDALVSGQTLEIASEMAIAAAPGLDLPRALHVLVTSGFVARLVLPEGDAP